MDEKDAPEPPAEPEGWPFDTHEPPCMPPYVPPEWAPTSPPNEPSKFLPPEPIGA